MRKLLLILLICSVPLFAQGRGGGRGGGGGERGGRGGGGGGARSPSMSRSMPARSAPHGGPSGGGGGRQMQPFQGGQRPSTQPIGRPNQRSEQDLRSFVKQREGGIKDRPQTQPIEQQRPRDIQGKRNDRISEGKNRRQNRGDDVRKHVSDHHDNWHNWFNDGFWDHHHYHPHYPYNRAYFRPATWAAVSAWLPWAATGAYFYYDGGDVYYSQTPDSYQSIVIAPLDYGATEEAIATPQGAENGTESDWLPLGNYALTSSSNTVVTPNMYMQLALNKQGRIEGTFYNSSSDDVFPVKGYVERETQRVVMQIIGDDHTPILETGLYNLTEGQAPVQLHFSNGQVQNWMLVKLESN